MKAEKLIIVSVNTMLGHVVKFMPTPHLSIIVVERLSNRQTWSFSTGLRFLPHNAG